MICIFGGLLLRNSEIARDLNKKKKTATKIMDKWKNEDLGFLKKNRKQEKR